MSSAQRIAEQDKENTITGGVLSATPFFDVLLKISNIARNSGFIPVTDPLKKASQIFWSPPFIKISELYPSILFRTNSTVRSLSSDQIFAIPKADSSYLNANA
ncbi:hypothetical protein DCO56_09695 [Sphingobacterium athyrii]|uniref:Uncharacterized protein n=2 Tax=Sphingobacterium athyrii TaxID=2152717 RepID=A0A363NWW0_9SPHI|nr:hypothetical protein DCO56_09695 [Sphingobacterium athyrii]